MISIIIVNYNGLKWLKRCFDSLFSQTYKDFEIVLVDNNSSDDSVKFLRENYKDERLKIVCSHYNLGFAGGNNLGIENSSGNYILLLNNDIWVENDFLEKLYNFYINNNFDAISCLDAPYNSDETIGIKKAYNTIDILGSAVSLYNQNKNDFLLPGACMLFNKDLYIETFGLDSNFFMYSEEIDWIWRIFLFNKKTFICDNIFYHHFGMGTTTGKSGINYKIFLWRNQNILQMLLKNYSWYNLVWILPLYFVQNIFEILFFLIILKPKIAFSYIEGWWFNIKNIKRIFKNRYWIQSNRVISDKDIIKRMYFGSAKLKALFNFLKHAKEK